VKQLYFLPCSCGRKIPIEPTQAGQRIPCACGATLEAPTLLAMTSLERVQPKETAVVRVSRWGGRQQMIVSGSLVFLLSLVWIAYLARTWPRRPEVDPQRMQQQYQAMQPVETWDRWQRLRSGLPDRDEEYFSNLSTARRWLAVALVVAAVGAGIIGGAFLVPKRIYRRRVVGRPRPQPPTQPDQSPGAPSKGNGGPQTQSADSP
jgi:hypothetical protein